MHKILLVEDDEVIRQQVKKMLEQWGYEVVLVEDFMEVLSIFVKVEPHLVLMDIGLPLFNGYHWCQEIRKVSKVPIMFLSSRDQAMDIVMAINMGGDDFVTKPFDQNVLLAKIQGLLRRSYEFGKDQSLLEYIGVILHLKAMDLVYQGEVVSLTKAGRNFLGLCPFHGEKTPSFNVVEDKQFYHCFGCGRSGDVFKFIEDYRGVAFMDAV